MSSYVSKKLEVFSSKAFRDSFKESFPRKVGYIFLSKSSSYPNENVAPSIQDTVSQEKQIWKDMILAKKVIPKDVELVIPKYVWTNNIRYREYDDTIALGNLLTGSANVNPMYVINADGDVYKCLSNNQNTLSTEEPIGNFTVNDGFIQTLDGYLWKYMYNVKVSNKFLTNEWMPVPYIQANTDFTSYNYSTTSVIEGTLNKIVVTNNGTNYFHPKVNVAAFSAGVTELLITDDVDLTVSNTINVNMLISGTGILQNETYITTIDPLKPKTLILSQPTIAAGGGNTNANIISILTRVVIEGDGSNTVTSVTLNTSSNIITKIDVVNAGINYNVANVVIYGSGTGATARAILPPKFGHGYNPAIELGASNVMILSRIGEIDATENNSIPTDIFFRQYGLLVNPYKYNENEPMSSNTIDIVSQTLDLTLLSLSSFTIGEKVYQGNVNNPSFVGYVVYQNSNVVKLNNTYKTPVPGSIITGTQSGNRNSVVGIKYPDLKPYAGDIIFARNILKVQRSIAQAEEIKLVFQF